MAQLHQIIIIVLALVALGFLLFQRGARRQLKHSEALFSGILDIASDAIISINIRSEITLFNKGAERVFGYSAKEMLGQPLELLLPEQFRNIHQKHIEDFSRNYVSAKLMGERREIYGRRKNGNEFPAEGSISKLTLDGETIFTVILRDISHRREIERKVSASLREKEVLLKEVHHRVKNNLQIISSLLSLQSRQTRDEKALAAIKESQNRVRSIALIHEMLYQSQNLAEINFREYLHALTSNLLRSYGRASAIQIEIDTEDAKLSLNSAIPCGLIINELVSNSLKHAFPQDRKGRIHVSVKQENNLCFSLLVRDDGVGFPSTVNYLEPETLGLRLVGSLTNQLGGRMIMETGRGNEGGTGFRITFQDSANSEDTRENIAAP